MTRTNKILLAVVAIAVAGAAYYFLALAPKREQIAKLDADIAAKKAEVAQAKDQLAFYEQARANYKANYARLVRLGKAAPADDDVRSLLVQLESAADDTGVEFEKIELSTATAAAPPGASASGGAAANGQSTAGELASAPGAVPVAGGVLSALPFSFSFSGSFFDLSTFFSELEHFVTVNNERIDATGRLLRLETLKIAPSPVGFPSMEAQVGAATYIVPPVEGVAGAPAPDAPPAAGTSQATPSSTTASATTGAAQ
jgi:Tfp pilus assembly protein PilO